MNEEKIDGLVLFNYFKDRFNMTDNEARKRTETAIQQKLRSLHPILNGKGANEDNLLFSQREEYFLYLQTIAKNQNKISIKKIDENFYVNRLINQENEFNRRMQSWADQWHGWLEEQGHTKKDVLLKYWKSQVKFDKKGRYINPLWSKLGLIP